jgi:Rod binding domain-containing protein
MDSAKSILTEPALLPTDPGNLNKVNGITERKKEQIAKDFESVLLSKLLDEVKNSIGDLGLDESGASKQIQGIFWLYLSRHIADNGGLGFWKDIYKGFTSPEQANKSTRLVDRKI